MESKQLFRLSSRLTNRYCIHRPFTTHLPRLHPAAPTQSSSPNPPSQPPPTQRPSNPKRAPRNSSSAALYNLANNLVESVQLPRAALNRVQQYDQKRNAIEELEKSGRARDLEKQVTRKWKAGDVYAPHDLSGVEMEKWRRRRGGERDVFDLLGMDPLGEWKNPSIMSEYMTNMGRIRHRRDTGLRAVNQRKIAKAIRRAVGMGMMPSVHKHPEILEAESHRRGLRRYEQGLQESRRVREPARNR